MCVVSLSTRRNGPAPPTSSSEADGDRLVERHALDADIDRLVAPKPHRAADHVAGELAQRRIELVDSEVVEAPRRGDAVLGIRQLHTEVAKVRRGLQVGIAL